MAFSHKGLVKIFWFLAWVVYYKCFKGSWREIGSTQLLRLSPVWGKCVDSIVLDMDQFAFQMMIARTLRWIWYFLRPPISTSGLGTSSWVPEGAWSKKQGQKSWTPICQLRKTQIRRNKLHFEKNDCAEISARLSYPNSKDSFCWTTCSYIFVGCVCQSDVALILHYIPTNKDGSKRPIPSSLKRIFQIIEIIENT